MSNKIAQLEALEGRHVSLALADGTRLDGCQLVSGVRRGVRTLWVFTGGADAFVPLADVVDVWEATPDSTYRAA